MYKVHYNLYRFFNIKYNSITGKSNDRYKSFDLPFLYQFIGLNLTIICITQDICCFLFLTLNFSCLISLNIGAYHFLYIIIVMVLLKISVFISNKTIQYNKSYIEWFCFYFKFGFFTHFSSDFLYFMVYLYCKHYVYVNKRFKFNSIQMYTKH